MKCDEYLCKQEASIPCCLCENHVCVAHAHFVDVVNNVKRYVCNYCYSTCMIALENKLPGEEDT